MFNINPTSKILISKDKQFLKDYVVELKKDTEYIPLFYINPGYINLSIQTNNSFLNEIINVNNSITNNISKKNYKFKVIECLNMYSDSFQMYDLKDHFKSAFEYSKKNIEDYLKDNSCMFNYYRTSITNSYESLFSDVKTNSTLKKVTLRDNTFLIRTGFFALFNNQFKPLFCAMIKREHLEYFKLCYLTNTPFNEDLIHYWIDSELTDNILLKNIKIAFNKFIKGNIKNANTKFVKKDNLFNELFDSIPDPVFKTISAKKEFENNVASDFFNDLSLQANMTNIIIDY